MNWLPEGLDKLDKRVAVFLVAAGALVAMYMSTMDKMDQEEVCEKPHVHSHGHGVCIAHSSSAPSLNKWAQQAILV